MLFSIVTPCFNSAKTIRQTFDSVLQQGFKDYEYIVVDGASTDGTVDIIREYEPKFEGRMRWISEPDKGIYDAVRKGFDTAKGEVFAWLGSDDVYLTNAFQTAARFFLEYPDVEWLTGEVCHIDEHGTLLNAAPLSKKHYRNFYFQKGYSLQQESTFWRRGLWEKCKDSFKDYRYAGDYALWLNFSKHAQLYPVPVLLAAFRLRNGQTSHAHMEEYMAEVREICQREKNSLTGKERFLLQLYSFMKGKPLLGKIAVKMEEKWDHDDHLFEYDWNTRKIERV